MVITEEGRLSFSVFHDLSFAGICPAFVIRTISFDEFTKMDLRDLTAKSQDRYVS